MPKLYRLLERAELNGALRDPGYVFSLPLDAAGKEIPGPHKTVVASNHGAQIAEHENATQGLTDVPLYVEIKDDPATPQDESIAEISPELEAANGRIAALEAELADKNAQLAVAHARLETIGDILQLPDEMIIDPPAGEGKPLLPDAAEGGTKLPGPVFG